MADRFSRFNEERDFQVIYLKPVSKRRVCIRCMFWHIKTRKKKCRPAGLVVVSAVPNCCPHSSAQHCKLVSQQLVMLVADACAESILKLAFFSSPRLRNSFCLISTGVLRQIWLLKTCVVLRVGFGHHQVPHLSARSPGDHCQFACLWPWEDWLFMDISWMTVASRQLASCCTHDD